MSPLAALIEDPLVGALGWTLLHFVWQGAAIGLAAFVALRVLRPADASVRYLVGLAALGTMLTAAVTTFAALSSSREMTWTAAAPRPAASTANGLVTGYIISDAPANPSAVRRLLPAPTPPPAPSSAAPVWLVGVTAAWSLGVLLLSLRLLGGWILTRTLARRAIAAVSPAVERAARQVAERLELSRAVAVLESSAVAVPTLVGWVRPVVLLPATALSGLTPVQLEAILAHELAHVRRHDYLANLLQSVVETLLFYHPAVWWVSAEVRAEREHCCDDLAVAVCGDRLLYVSALAELTSMERRSLALAATDGSLLARVRRILDRPVERRRELPPSWGILAVLAVLAGAGSFEMTNASAGALLPSGDARVSQPPRSLQPPNDEGPRSGAPVTAGPATGGPRGRGPVGSGPADDGPIAGAPAMPGPVTAREIAGAPATDGPIAPDLSGAPGAGAPGDGAPDGQAAPAAFDQHPAPDAPLVPVAPVAPVDTVGPPAVAPVPRTVPVAPVAPPAPVQAPPAPPGLPAPPVPPAPPAPPSPPPPAEIQVSRGEGNFSWNTNGERVTVKWTGPFRLSDDERDIVWIEEGARVTISNGWVFTDRIELRGLDGGRVERSFYKSGFRQEYESEGRLFLANTLSRMIRAGMFASQRVTRLLAQGGPDAVLAEVDRLQTDSNYVKRVYYSALLKQTTLNSDQLGRLLQRVADGMSSDYDRATLLVQIIREGRLTEEQQILVARSVRRINSDYEQRKVLSALLAAAPLTAAVTTEVIESTEAIGSAYDRSTVLVDLAGKGALTPETSARFMAVVNSMGSAYEQRKVLAALASSNPLPEPVVLDSVKAAGAIGSAYDKRQALAAYVARGAGSPKIAVATLASAASIGSSHDKSEVLLEIVKKGGFTDETASAFFSAASTIGSSYDLSRVLRAVAARPQLQEATLIALIRTAGDVSSSYDRASLMLEILKTQTLPPQARAAFLDTAQTIGSQHDQNRVLAELVRSERR